MTAFWRVMWTPTYSPFPAHKDFATFAEADSFADYISDDATVHEIGGAA